MQEISAILWVKEFICSRQAINKRLECFTVHLITTVDSVLGHDGLLSTLWAFYIIT